MIDLGSGIQVVATGGGVALGIVVSRMFWGWMQIVLEERRALAGSWTDDLQARDAAHREALLQQAEAHARDMEQLREALASTREEISRQAGRYEAQLEQAARREHAMGDELRATQAELVTAQGEIHRLTDDLTEAKAQLTALTDEMIELRAAAGERMSQN